MLIDALPLADAAAFRCRDLVTTGLDTGHHNAGQECQNGCHHGFYLSGMLYSSAAGGQPLVGAAITFIDATGATSDMRSGSNGNFWWTLPAAFPVTLIASACPTIDRMTAAIGSTEGGCTGPAATPRAAAPAASTCCSARCRSRMTADW